MRKDWAKARLKPIRANTKSCTIVWETGGFSNKGLSWPCLRNLSYISHLLWLLPLPICSSLWQMSHSLGISTSCGLHPSIFMQWTLTVYSLGLWLCQTYMPATVLNWNYWITIHDLNFFAFLASTTSTTWEILPSLASKLGWTLLYLLRPQLQQVLYEVASRD